MPLIRKQGRFSLTPEEYPLCGPARRNVSYTGTHRASSQRNGLGHGAAAAAGPTLLCRRRRPSPILVRMAANQYQRTGTPLEDNPRDGHVRRGLSGWVAQGASHMDDRWDDGRRFQSKTGMASPSRILLDTVQDLTVRAESRLRPLPPVRGAAGRFPAAPSPARRASRARVHATTPRLTPRWTPDSSRGPGTDSEAAIASERRALAALRRGLHATEARLQELDLRGQHARAMEREARRVAGRERATSSSLRNRARHAESLAEAEASARLRTEVELKATKAMLAKATSELTAERLAHPAHRVGRAGGDVAALPSLPEGGELLTGAESRKSVGPERWRVASPARRPRSAAAAQYGKTSWSRARPARSHSSSLEQPPPGTPLPESCREGVDLDLSGRGLDDDDLRTRIVRICTGSPHAGEVVSSLNLSNNHLTDAAAVIVGAFLTHSSFCRLQAVDLSGNEVTAAGAQVLEEAMRDLSVKGVAGRDDATVWFWGLQPGARIRKLVITWSRSHQPAASQHSRRAAASSKLDGESRDPVETIRAPRRGETFEHIQPETRQAAQDPLPPLRPSLPVQRPRQSSARARAAGRIRCDSVRGVSASVLPEPRRGDVGSKASGLLKRDIPSSFACLTTHCRASGPATPPVDARPLAGSSQASARGTGAGSPTHGKKSAQPPIPRARPSEGRHSSANVAIDSEDGAKDEVKAVSEKSAESGVTSVELAVPARRTDDGTLQEQSPEHQAPEGWARLRSASPTDATAGDTANVIDHTEAQAAATHRSSDTTRLGAETAANSCDTAGRFDGKAPCHIDGMAGADYDTGGAAGDGGADAGDDSKARRSWTHRLDGALSPRLGRASGSPFPSPQVELHALSPFSSFAAMGASPESPAGRAPQSAEGGASETAASRGANSAVLSEPKPHLEGATETLAPSDWAPEGRSEAGSGEVLWTGDALRGMSSPPADSSAAQRAHLSFERQSSKPRTGPRRLRRPPSSASLVERRGQGEVTPQARPAYGRATSAAALHSGIVRAPMTFDRLASKSV